MAKAISTRTKQRVPASVPASIPSTESAATPASSAQAPLAASPTQESRESKVAVAAYYRAERRGFAPGYELEDWLAAEAEITSASLQKEATPAELH